MTALGVPLARIKALLAAPDGSSTGDEAAHKRIFQARVVRRDLAETIARAQALDAALARAEDRAMGCFRCKEKPDHATCTACPTGAMAEEPTAGG